MVGFCGECGSELNSEGKFCQNCGQAVKSSSHLKVPITSHRRVLRMKSTIVLFVAFVISVTVVSIAAVISGSNSTSGERVSKGEASVSLRVIECPSEYGVEYSSNESPSPIIGRYATVEIPVPLKGKVSLYTDQYRMLEPILAPAHWKCEAQVGADGTGGLSVTPVGDNPNGEDLTFSFVPACVGCAFDVYCPFVTPSYAETVNEGPCTYPPASQIDKVMFQSPSTSEGTIFIEDPPGSAGTLTPFEQPQSDIYATVGYLSYGYGQPIVQSLSCTLPTTKLNICKASWKVGFDEKVLTK